MKKLHMTYLVVGTAFFLAGCQHVENFDQVHKTPEPVVNKVETRLDIAFEYGSSHLGDGERQRIENFIMAHDASRLDDLEIEIAEQGGPLAHQRAETIAAYFTHLGLKSHYKWRRDEDSLQTVEVSLGKYQVHVPDCPNWSRDPGHNFNNQVMPNFGCAQASNLALMIGDPRDLIRGRELTPTDSHALHQTFDLYRNPTKREHVDLHNVEVVDGAE